MTINQVIGNLSLMLELPLEVRDRVTIVIRDASESVQLQKGAQLFALGETVTDYGYIVVQGRVQIDGPHGFEKTLQAPVILGEMKQFQFEGQSKRMATVRALEPIEVLRFRWKDLYAALSAALDPEGLERFNEALEHHAWMHYLDLQDEL